MDSSLHEVWQAASGSPFVPTVGKNSQFLVGFFLTVLGIALTGAFALSMFYRHLAATIQNFSRANQIPDRSIVSLPVLGLPASVALAYVYQNPILPSPSPPIAVYSSNQGELQQDWRGIHVLCSRSLRLEKQKRYPEKESPRRISTRICTIAHFSTSKKATSRFLPALSIHWPQDHT
ncbi:hypothetical protein B0T17DRAFT_328106 [Bombardia bombarda]|uniref:Uncharacterized protein n=1 Tax=Bombardia bombarda TaxID=252184 RepID=A0AA39WMK7_9PEZI|nr:hypothetical protein B0T17DRAFT_328106 [Bombardia bombarda]